MQLNRLQQTLLAFAPKYFSSISTISNKSISFPQSITSILQKRFLNEIGENPYIDMKLEILQKASNILQNELDNESKEKIHSVMKSNIGYLILNNIPEDPDLMATPLTDGIIEKKKQTFVKEYFTLGIAHMLGMEIFNFAQEGWGTGKLIFNVFPLKELKNIKGAGGTDSDFRFHTENAWHPIAIESVILAGMRPDHEKKAETYVVSSQEIIENLDEEDIKILSQESFIIAPPEIHRKMEADKGIPFTASESYVGPILTWTQEHFPKLRINFNGMRPQYPNPKHLSVLNKVETIAKERCQTVKLDSNNMVIINNPLAIHTRNGYVARFDGGDRWFQRYFFTSSSILWKNEPVTHSDFNGLLTQTETELLIEHLKTQDLCDSQNCLTTAFKPYHSNDFLLPTLFKDKGLEIKKCLIRKGPPKGNRVV